MTCTSQIHIDKKKQVERFYQIWICTCSNFYISKVIFLVYKPEFGHFESIQACNKVSGTSFFWYIHKYLSWTLCHLSLLLSTTAIVSTINLSVHLYIMHTAVHKTKKANTRVCSTLFSFIKTMYRSIIWVFTLLLC